VYFSENAFILKMVKTYLVGLLLILPLVHIIPCNGQGTAQKIDPRTEHNKEHLKEDLDGIIDKNPEEMTNEELQFHYFRQHDYDGDNMLDGNEIVMSLFHHAKNNPNEQGGSFHSDEELITIVDDVLKYQDRNNDGKISYQEYITPFQQDQSP